MALENSPNKMVTNPPAKKGFHFAGTLEHAAAYIEAETIAEAETIYHKIKKPINQPSNTQDGVGGTVEPALAEQAVISTAPAEDADKK